MKTLLFACIGLLLCACDKETENTAFIPKPLISTGIADLYTKDSAPKEAPQEPAQGPTLEATLGATHGATLEASQGATQISGIAFFDATDECNSAGEGATFSLIMTGDLEGCLYTYVDEFDCSPSGTYKEIGREYFVGTYNGESGSFWTNYKFEAKFEGCAEDGSYIGAEIKGRCQHPIVKNSGTGVFEGVTGRMDFKDDVEAGNYPYRGHLNGLN